MAAAGGNNWTWDALRIYNPDFRLDAQLKPDMSAGTLTAGIVPRAMKNRLPDPSEICAPDFKGKFL
jgi:hypothetical protein